MEILRFIFNLITEYGLFVIWLIALALLVFYFCCFYQKFKNNRGKVVDGYSVLMFISLLTGGFLILLPADKNNPGFNILESIYCSLKLFYADGTARFNLEDTALNIMYRGMYYALCFLAPLTLVCTVLSHFDNFINIIKIHYYALHPKRNIIIFSELNQKNLSIVKNFKEEDNKKKDNKKRIIKKRITQKKDNKKNTNAFFNYNEYYNLENENKKIFIFCDVYKQNTEASSELVEAALEAGCILLKEDIVSIHKNFTQYKIIRKILFRTSKRKLTRYFLSSTDENENVSQAVEIAKIEKDFLLKKSSEKTENELVSQANKNAKKESNLKNFALFTFAEQDANGYILEALNTCDDFFVLRLKPSLMTAIDILTNSDNWLTKTEKDLKVLILGLGKYGFEIGKFLSWYYQRKKGNISIHFADKDNAILENLSGSYYDFLNYSPNLNKRDQNACFEIKIHKGINVFSDDFTHLIEDIYDKANPGIDAVFCALGDDNTNIEAALHTRKLLDRLNHKKLYNINKDAVEKVKNIDDETDIIFSCVNDINKNNNSSKVIELSTTDYSCDDYVYENKKLNDKIKIFSLVHGDKIKNNLCKSSGFIQKCNIRFVGEDSSVYSIKNIFDAELESNRVRKRVKDTKNNNTKDNVLLKYNSDEYIRLSSISEALHFEYIESIYPKKSTKEYIQMRRKIGNKRWNAYMLSIGYTHFDDVPEEYRKALYRLKDKNQSIPMRKWSRGKWHNSIIPFDMLPEKEQNNNYTPTRLRVIKGLEDLYFDKL